MALQLDHKTHEIRYNDKVVGQHTFNDGKYLVNLCIEYETEGDWFTPLSHFAMAIKKLNVNHSEPADLQINLVEADVDNVPDARVYLDEKTIKSSGFVWRFPKSDVDDWPSPLHAHDYEKGLKLDAITGKIFDVVTRAHSKTIKPIVEI